MRTYARSVLVLVVLLSTPIFASAADAVLTWNDLMATTLVTQGQSPFAQARSAAIVQLAVFEAVNSITGDYEPYRTATYNGIVAPVGASPEAAAIAAAYRVLKTYFPAAPLIDAARASSLAAIPDGPAKTNGVTTGELAAAALIAERANDHSSPLTISPIGPPAPGVYQITTPPGCTATATGGSFYNWGDVTPFGIPSVDDFRLPPPPSVTSNQFAKGLNEVKTVGSALYSARPTDRRDVVLFYQSTSPTFAFNLVARQIAEAQQRSLSENARGLALLNIATNDSLVASFDNKYFYNFWRPETAIRFADDYGNKKVEADTSWKPFIGTPCFPSYPSNHASGSNGGAEILRRLYGEGGHSIDVSNPLVPAIAGIQLHYTTFNQICDDVDDARVFGGIHYPFDQAAGNQLGRGIATYVYKHNLRKVNGPE